MTDTGLRLGIAELRRRPGNRYVVQRQVPVGEIATSTASIPPPHEVGVDLVLEALSDGLTVTGTISVPWEGECRRCLEPTSGVATAEVLEVFKDRPDEGDTHAIDGDQVDLGPVVHDLAVMSLPLAPLCSDDCVGPAPSEFPVATESEPVEPPADPRWAALSELRFDSEPED
ncbi:MAG: YceD family protein [Actinomycetota bacterium]|nr:YceD family protein [Actinomycetota bacterium]